MNKRTHTCGELNSKQVGKQVCLKGWVNTIRLHGQVIFVDIRDRYGKTQLVFNTEKSEHAFNTAQKLSIEDVISVSGIVQSRSKEAINAFEIEEGDEVLVQAFTCVVVTNSVKHTGAKPIYVDIEKDGYNMDVEDLKKKITPRTRVIIVQHTFGIPADIEKIMEIFHL